METVSSSMKLRELPERVVQLMADDLNQYLRGEFISSLSECFQYYPSLRNKLIDEIELCVDLLMWWFTIRQDKPLLGDELYNCAYQPLTTNQRRMWLVVSALLTYIRRKISPNNEKLQAVVTGIYRLISIASCVNSFLFLINGKHRSLLYFVLGITMRKITPNVTRNLDFSLMNRRMIWTIFELFIKTILPLAFRVIAQPLKNVFYLTSYMSPSEAIEADQCVFCAYSVVMATSLTPCGHLSCFYCAKTDSEKHCGKCKYALTGWKVL